MSDYRFGDLPSPPYDNNDLPDVPRPDPRLVEALNTAAAYAVVQKGDPRLAEGTAGGFDTRLFARLLAFYGYTFAPIEPALVPTS